MREIEQSSGNKKIDLITTFILDNKPGTIKNVELVSYLQNPKVTYPHGTTPQLSKSKSLPDATELWKLTLRRSPSRAHDDITAYDCQTTYIAHLTWTAKEAFINRLMLLISSATQEGWV